MVDRIDKTDRFEYWQVASSAEAHKDRGQGGDANEENKQSSRDGFASLGEATDWRLLFDKSKLWKRNIQVSRDEVKKVVFRKINLKTDPSLLRVDVELNGGETISPAFLSISRSVGLKIKNLQAGDTIPDDLIFQKDILSITTPLNPSLFVEQEGLNEKKIPPTIQLEEVDPTQELTIKSREVQKNLQKIREHLKPEMAMIYAVLIVTLLFTIAGFILIRSIK